MKPDDKPLSIRHGGQAAKLLRTPTLRSGGLKLSYIEYGKCGYIVLVLKPVPFWSWFSYFIKEKSVPCQKAFSIIGVYIMWTNSIIK